MTTAICGCLVGFVAVWNIFVTVKYFQANHRSCPNVPMFTVDKAHTALSEVNQSAQLVEQQTPKNGVAILGYSASTLKLYEKEYQLWESLTTRTNAFPKPWYSLYPLLPCPHMISIPATFDDGRKWICPTMISTEKCVIYSIGINGNVEFDVEVKRLFPQCTILAVDGTSAVTQKSKDELKRIGATLVPKLLSSHASTEHGNYVSIRGLAAAHGHTHIDILKIDIEGAEWSILSNLDDELSGLHVGQIQLEIHIDTIPNGIQQAHQLVKRFHRAGFGLSFVEANEYCDSCRELVFTNRNFQFWNVELNWLNHL